MVVRALGIALAVGVIAFGVYSLGALWLEARGIRPSASSQLPPGSPGTAPVGARSAAARPDGGAGGPGPSAAAPSGLERAALDRRPVARGSDPLAPGTGAPGEVPRTPERERRAGGSAPGGGGTGRHSTAATGGPAGADATPTAETPGEDVESPAGDLDAPLADDPRAPESAYLLESAAQVAEALELVDPLVLEQRVAQRVPEGSVPEEYLEAAREQARREILAEAAIAEDMAHAYDDRRQRSAARGLAQTLVPSYGEDFRDRKLDGVPERLEP